MNPQRLKRRAQIFVDYASQTAVRRACRISDKQLKLALSAEPVAPDTAQALQELRFVQLEAQAMTVVSKGTRLRLRAMYAEGLSMATISEWDPQNKPKYLDRRRLWRYALAYEGERVNTEYHQWVRKAYESREEIEPTKMDQVCADRAASRGWFRGQDLEADLIDMPETWAAKILTQRVEALTLSEFRDAYVRVRAGERAQLLTVAAHIYHEQFGKEAA